MTHSELARIIDHTLLKPDALPSSFEKLFAEALEHSFFSVCIPPAWIARARTALKGSHVKVCTVIGFPLGYTLTSVKAFEAAQCLDRGADELDMVLNIHALKAGDFKFVESDIAEVVKAAQGKLVKVILETCYLNDEQKRQACRLAEAAGAKFVKTSTGFGSGGATQADVRLMREVVSAAVQVKASGGIRDTKSALEMVDAGATRLGTSASVEIVTGVAANSQGGY